MRVRIYVYISEDDHHWRAEREVDLPFAPVPGMLFSVTPLLNPKMADYIGYDVDKGDFWVSLDNAGGLTGAELRAAGWTVTRE